MSCNCSGDWRVELLDLGSGVRKTYAKPISLTFEESLNQVGSGELALPIRSVQMSDIWPHLTSVMVTRIAGIGASPSNPVGMWRGLVGGVAASSDGQVSLGMDSIEKYLEFQIISDGYKADKDQTAIGSDLANIFPAIPLQSVASGDPLSRAVDYVATDYKVRLEAIQELTELSDGPDYVLTHEYAGGVWTTFMTFVSRAGDQTPRPLNARQSITSYNLNVDAGNHRNIGWGIGGTPEQGGDMVSDVPDTPFTSIARDLNTIYPPFEKVDQWDDAVSQAAIDAYTRGAMLNDRHPRAVPSVTVADLDVAVRFNLGDVIALKMNHGALQYVGDARLVSKSWSIGEGQPTTCTFGFVPETDPFISVLSAPPAGPTGCC